MEVSVLDLMTRKNLGNGESSKGKIFAPIPQAIDNGSIANGATLRPETVEGTDFKVLPVCQHFSSASVLVRWRSRTCSCLYQPNHYHLPASSGTDPGDKLEGK